MLFRSYNYITGIQYLNYMADMFSVDREHREERIKKYAELFGITDSLGNLVSSYSHGMKQKLALIGAFLHEPKLLVLDEPFVGLDPEAAFHLKQIMRDLCNQGSAIFFPLMFWTLRKSYATRFLSSNREI